MGYELYEDSIVKEKENDPGERFSPYCDFVFYRSTVDPELRLAMKVIKPEKPGYILVTTHGWHGSISDFEYMDRPVSGNDYLMIEVDMRGRAFSQGKQDCNGWELYDIIDAVNVVRKRYSRYILDPGIVHFEGGSGSGGNAYALACKFPDFFASINVLCGISDYEAWYRNDQTGEFRDEMDVWIGFGPDENISGYRARSGAYLIQNIITPMTIFHGETDIRVPVFHARLFVQKAKEAGKYDLVSFFELKGVGTRKHWGNATAGQMEDMARVCEDNRKSNSSVLNIPEKGIMAVGGYLITKRFFRDT